MVTQTTNTAVPYIGLLFMMFFFFAILALVVCIWGMIFKKAGYSFWMALLILIPLVNLIWLLIFAFSKWPIQQELEAYRERAGYSGGGFPVTMPPR